MSSYNEEAYRLDSPLFGEKILIAIKNEEVGKQIYDLVRALKKDKRDFNYISFDGLCEVYDYTVKNSTIDYLVINLPINLVTVQIEIDIDIIIVVLDFIITMSEKLKNLGYSLNKEKFKKLRYYSGNFSGILACFDTEHREEQEIEDNLIRCCHIILAPKIDFDEFYGKTLNNRIMQISELPYDLSIVKKCYQYFNTKEAGSVAKIFLDIYPKRNFQLYKNEVRIGSVIPPNIDILNNAIQIRKSNLGYKICEVLDKKILFCKDSFSENVLFEMLRYNETVNLLCKEKLIGRVVDWEGQNVGIEVELSAEDVNETHITDAKISEITIGGFEDYKTNNLEQRKLFKFFCIFIDFLTEAKSLKKDLELDNVYYEHPNLNLEQAICCDSNFNFKFENLDYLISFLGIKEEKWSSRVLDNITSFSFLGTKNGRIKAQVVELFLKMYKELIERLFGKISNEEELFLKLEIRYISPVITEEFLKYYFSGKVSDYLLIFDKLKRIISGNDFFDSDCYKKGNEFLDCNDVETQNNLVFEDDIAVHYKYASNPKYNIKIYKQNAINMITMERKVNKFILGSSTKMKERCMQDCFIPIKKLYSNDGIFLGYMYKKFYFEDESVIDLEDKNRMKNLHRLKALVRLLMQIKALLENGLGFSQNPYGNVFISKKHKQQVQLTNIEFVDETKDLENTIRWTYEYVTKVIASDENIDGGMDIIKESRKNFKAKIKDLDNLLEKLQNLANGLTGYCDIHQYYNGEHIFCPRCIAPKDVGNIKVVYTTPGEITSQKEVGKGGEAIAYKYKENCVAKVFKEDILDYGFKLSTLAKIYQKSRTIEQLNKGNEKIQYIIPQALLIDISKRRFFGYTMRKVKGTPIAALKDKETLSKNGFNKKDILEILIEVGNGIEALHDIGIFIGDLNGNNILFDEQKRVYFLDFDGMGFDGNSSGFYTEGYIDPISAKNQMITEKDDWYSFAIQAFHYLVGTHPFNGIYIQNGKMLEIPEKMELRISLLGNHGMEPPKMAEPWDWMSTELEDAFYNTFEGDLRTNIVPLLINQYNRRGEDNRTKSKESRTKNKGENTFEINSKFMAKVVNPMDGCTIKYAINLNAVICKGPNGLYVVVSMNNHRYYILINDVPFSKGANKIRNIEISEDNYLAFIITDDEFFVYDLIKKSCIYQATLEGRKVIVKDNLVYYIENHGGENYVIVEKTWIDDYIRTPMITFYEVPNSTEKPKCFGVETDRKFVLVQKGTVDGDEIYCNDLKLCNIDCKNENTKYNIVYDKGTRTWLVINEENNVVVIKPKAIFDSFKLDDNIKVSVDNISYLNGRLYIPGTEELWIVNVQKDFKCKKMVCNKIMKPTSKVCETNAKGFTVITDGVCYEVSKI
mgnify:CR=1 FL=1